MKSIEKLWQRVYRTPWLLFPIAIVFGLIIGLLTTWVPILGYDWIHMFHANQATDIYYPPWTSIILAPLAQLPAQLGLALINGITIAAVALTTFYQGRGNQPWRKLAVVLALLSPQTLIVLWTGHIDGLALLGIWALPWAIPIVLMKSTFIGFAVITRKSWFLTALGFGLLSFFLWPDWIPQLIETLQFRSTHPASAGWQQTGFLPLALGLILLLFSRREDVFQNIAAGAILYPFILPYHYIVLLPALAELKGSRLVLVWLSAWLMVVPIALEKAFPIYFIFPLLIWWARRSPGNTVETSQETWLQFLTRQLQKVRAKEIVL